MGWYLLKLAVLLPLIGLAIWGSLRLAQRMQARLGVAAPGKDRRARVVESTMLSPGQRLAVIEFHGREILVAATRHGLHPAGGSGPAPRCRAAAVGDGRLLALPWRAAERRLARHRPCAAAADAPFPARWTGPWASCPAVRPVPG